jgi:hypothetical protein
MQIRTKQEIIMCESCMSILMDNGECPYCGRKQDEEDK